MNHRKEFEFLEHTADAYIAAYGRDLKEAFENAAMATFEVMTETKNINPEDEDYIELEAPDVYALLYNWLEALIVKSEICGMLYSKFKVLSIDKALSGFRFKARIWGEKYDQRKHVQKVGVKAVTYHRMEVVEKPGKVTMKFILDI